MTKKKYICVTCRQSPCTEAVVGSDALWDPSYSADGSNYHQVRREGDILP